MRIAHLPVLLSVLLVGSCAAPDEAPLVEPVLDASVEIVPNSASAGVPRNIGFFGQDTDWRAGEVDVDFGDGVDVPVLLVDSTFHLTAQVLVADDAVPGPRDVTVRQADQTVVLRGAFFVEEGSISLTPDRAALGDTRFLEITGWQTRFLPNHSIVSFGPQVNVEDVEVLSSSRIRATIHVPHRSTPGPVDVAVYNPGAEVYTLAHGFVIDRDAHDMSIYPDEADQGQTLLVRIDAEGAPFTSGPPVVALGTGVITENVTVLGATQLLATLRIGNNATTGPRDVVVTTDVPGSDPDVRILLDGFSIWPVDADPLRARVSLSFGISRIFDPDECEYSTNVYASAVFYEPNDFPCPSSGAFSTLSPPPHFDLPGTGFTMSGGSTDCPPSKTFDAGPYVEFVGEPNTIELARNVHPYTGRISYRAMTLDIPDYKTDTLYDLVTPGGDLGYSALPAWTIPEALRTLPRVYLQHEPNYCQMQQPLDEELTVEWDPADTYDESEMYLYILGPAQDEGVPIMMVYPWDDGEFTYSTDQVGFFTAGSAMLLQNAYRQTRFDVLGSEYVNGGFATSNLLWRGSFFFVDPG